MFLSTIHSNLQNINKLGLIVSSQSFLFIDICIYQKELQYFRTLIWFAQHVHIFVQPSPWNMATALVSRNTLTPSIRPRVKTQIFVLCSCSWKSNRRKKEIFEITITKCVRAFADFYLRTIHWFHIFSSHWREFGFVSHINTTILPDHWLLKSYQGDWRNIEYNRSIGLTLGTSSWTNRLPPLHSIWDRESNFRMMVQHTQPIVSRN